MSEDPALQSRRFLVLLALASAGGAIAYVPLLTLLLPAHVARLSGAASVGWLAYLTFAGAIAASAAGIAAGWLSDLTGHRRLWIAGGLVGSTTLLMLLGRTTDFSSILILLVLWQLALNAMLGPLVAWAGDTIPDVQKGTLGGLLAFAPAAGAATGALVTWPGLADPAQRLAVVAVLVAACVLPLVLFGRPRAIPAIAPHTASPPPRRHEGAVRMWFARLLVQVSEAALFAYFYLWFRTLGPQFGDAAAGQLIGAVLFAGAPLALAVGRIADTRGAPIAPLRWGAGLAAAGLVIMALADTPLGGIGGYVVFGLATSVFLALHSAQTLRVLPRPDRRGRDLGVFNLTNTVPSLIMPWLTLALVPVFGFAGLFAALAILSGSAVLLLRGGITR